MQTFGGLDAEQQLERCTALVLSKPGIPDMKKHPRDRDLERLRRQIEAEHARYGAANANDER